MGKMGKYNYIHNCRGGNNNSHTRRVNFSIGECEFGVTRQPGECKIYRQKHNFPKSVD